MPATSTTLCPVLTAMGDPWSQPLTTTPKLPAPRIWPSLIFKSSEGISQRCFKPRLSMESKFCFSASFWPCGSSFRPRSTSTCSKTRPVAVVSGKDSPRTERAALDWLSSGPTALDWLSSSDCASGSGHIWHASSKICVLGPTAVSRPQAVLRPTRKAAVRPARPSVLTSRFPTMNNSTLILWPATVISVDGMSTGDVLARTRQSWKRSVSSSAK
mmetsp:Transcript_31574/g.98190  ORF Transcript_31574/g.98190 Transcript_31574/m.98190 type:complete len:215 (+) Transcript_31574:865-1509(+)